MSDKVVYTKKNLDTKYHQGGKSHINYLIKKKSHDIFGVYDPLMKAEIAKTWWGKGLLMFKNFFLSGLEYRYKGFSSSLKSKEELTDVLMLSRIVNTDAQHVRKNMLSDNKALPKIVNPEKAIQGLIQSDTQSHVNPQLQMDVSPLPTAIGPQGQELVVSPPKPLIPLPDGYQIPNASPAGVQAPLVQRMAPVTPVASAAPVVTPPINEPQLELPLSYEKRTEFQNLREYFDDKLSKLDTKFDMINAKLNELLTRKRGPYGPRTSKSNTNI
jgi:hypothetical protein